MGEIQIIHAEEKTLERRLVTWFQWEYFCTSDDFPQYLEMYCLPLPPLAPPPGPSGYV